jgi:predicted AAA+ superfamily ATPase
MTNCKRFVVDEIDRFLSTDDIVVIHGSRQVGKTSILMFLQPRLISEGEQGLYPITYSTWSGVVI